MQTTTWKQREELVTRNQSAPHGPPSGTFSLNHHGATSLGQVTAADFHGNSLLKPVPTTAVTSQTNFLPDCGLF